MSESPSTTQAFGVGSFWFSPAELARSPFTGRQYFDAVLELLESSDATTVVSVERDALFERSKFSLSEAEIEDVDYWDFPDWGLSRIDFGVSLSYERQREILDEHSYLEPERDVGAERFLVCLRRGYQLPVTAVFPQDGQDPRASSRSVMVVRKFLAQEFPELGNSVCFGFGPPSPMHSEFVMRPTQRSPRSGVRRFSAVSSKLDGYRVCEFAYDQRQISSGLAAGLEFFEELISELDLHYSYARHRGQGVRNWDDIETGIGKIAEIDARTGVSGAIARHRRLGALTRNVFILLSEYERSRILGESQDARDYASVYGEGAKYWIRDAVEDARVDYQSYPVAETRELLKTYDARRASEVNATLVLAASIVGAALGASASALLGG